MLFSREVGNDQECLTTMETQVCVYVSILRIKQLMLAKSHHVTVFTTLAKLNQLSVVMEYRIRVRYDLLGIDAGVVGIHGQPGFTRRKAGMLLSYNFV